MIYKKDKNWGKVKRDKKAKECRQKTQKAGAFLREKE